MNNPKLRIVINYEVSLMHDLDMFNDMVQENERKGYSYVQ